MRRILLLSFLPILVLLGQTGRTNAEGLMTSSSHFYYRNSEGAMSSAAIVHRYWRVKIIHPDARVDSRIDPKLRRAATIAEEHASAFSHALCWRSVKEALVEAGVVNTYPKTNYACQAGDELARNYGFRKIPVRDPYDAPFGAVLVFGRGSNGAGHVEFRSRTGFVSDYRTHNRCRYPLLAVYGKFSS